MDIQLFPPSPPFSLSPFSPFCPLLNIHVPLDAMKEGDSTEVFTAAVVVTLFHVFLKHLHVFLKHPHVFLKHQHVFLKHIFLQPTATSAFAFTFASAFLLPSCNPDPYTLEPFNLAPYGIPITIMAPDSAVVIVKEYEQLRDITIRKHDRFNIQLFEFSPSFNDAKGEKLRQLASVKEAPFFKQVLWEEDHGFIFSRQPDSLTTRYDFRYIRLVGDKELIFQTGLVGDYSLDDVKRMYEAVK